MNVDSESVLEDLCFATVYMIYPHLRPGRGQITASTMKPKPLTYIQMNLVRRHETIHVVQFKDGLIKVIQDQCHTIISLGE
jgi:hypothetical protein